MKPCLSKSKYMLGLQCPKLLWFHFNEKDKIPPISEATQATFDQGHEVGEWAKKRFPDGIEVPFGDFKLTLEKTKELLAKRKTIFEASFLFENCYSRADILVPVGEDEWDVIEVKKRFQSEGRKYRGCCFSAVRHARLRIEDQPMSSHVRQ
jgi:hypothetical protein